MPSTPPTTIDEIRATGTIAPEFAEVWGKSPFPPGSFFTLEDLKDVSKFTLPQIQATLAKSRPEGIVEKQHFIKLRDNYASRILVLYREADLAPKTPARPLIVLYHGGGHTVGNPEGIIPLARAILKSCPAVIICASYRLAPEFPFPFSILDSWETLEWAASESRKFKSTVLPLCTDPRVGFIVGGESAGAGLAAELSHLARDQRLFPKLTGQFLCCGTFISPERVPANYQERFLSWSENKSAPLLDEDLYAIFRDAFKADHDSKLWASFNQHHPADAGTGSVKHGHMEIPRTYFQVCGLDMARDDSLIYERVLREECSIETRLDLYAGWPHCWWLNYPKLDMSEKRMNDAVEGLTWLLESGKKR